MKKSTRIILYVLLLLGAGALLYQLLPIKKKSMQLLEKPYVEGVLKGTVSNSDYKYLLVNLFEQDSTIYITEGNTTRSVQLQVFDTVDIINGEFMYTYKLKEPFIYPRIIYLANDSGYCEQVSFQNPYINRPNSYGGICMDRGAQIILTIDGQKIRNSNIIGSTSTDALFRRRAEEDAKAIEAEKVDKTKQAKTSLLQKKKAAEQAKKIQDSIQNSHKNLDTATMRNFSGGRTKIYLKPKKSPVQ